jgi:hypothetical protein
MLFDLRSRRRRHLIQVVYLFLAILIGGGLVLFGVGGGSGSTGILSGLGQNGNGSASGLALLDKAAEKAKRTAQANPASDADWAMYVFDVYRIANSPEDLVATSTTSEAYTQAGAKELKILTTAWKHYIALAPAHPDVTLANAIEDTFGPNGVHEYVTAESADELLVQAEPNSAHAWADLAADAYYAHEVDRAEIAQAKAIQLAPKSERLQLKSYLDAIAAKAEGSTGASGSTATGGATGSSG